MTAAGTVSTWRDLATAHDALRPDRVRRYRVALPLRSPIDHAAAREPVIESLLLAADFGGVLGVAEVRTNAAYGTGEDAVRVNAALDAVRQEGAPVGLATESLARRSRLAALALDMAAWDALGKRLGTPVARLLNPAAPDQVRTHAQIPFGSPAEAAARARAARAAGFTRLKVRVGSPDPQDDLDRLRALRNEPGTGQLDVSVDANGGWTLDQALMALPWLEDLGVTWLEQPVRQAAEMNQLVRRANGVRIRADEIARDASSVRALAAAGAAHGVHLKLEKAGTLGALLMAVEEARRCGLDVAIGQFDQGRLGCAATTQVAAALGCEHAELWGCAEVDDDIAGPLTLDDGAVLVPSAPGLGVDVDWDAVTRRTQ